MHSTHRRTSDRSANAQTLAPRLRPRQLLKNREVFEPDPVGAAVRCRRSWRRTPGRQRARSAHEVNRNGLNRPSATISRKHVRRQQPRVNFEIPETGCEQGEKRKGEGAEAASVSAGDRLAQVSWRRPKSEESRRAATALIVGHERAVPDCRRSGRTKLRRSGDRADGHVHQR